MSNQPVDLSEQLLEEQEAAWRSGRRISVDELLARHGLGLEDPELVLDLIEGEILLRRDRGEQSLRPPDLAEFALAPSLDWRAVLRR